MDKQMYLNGSENTQFKTLRKTITNKKQMIHTSITGFK